MSLTKEVAKWGNALAVRIPKPMLDAVGLEASSPVELEVEKGRLIITPVQRQKGLTVADLLKGVTPENSRFEEDEVWLGSPAVGTEQC